MNKTSKPSFFNFLGCDLVVVVGGGGGGVYQLSNEDGVKSLQLKLGNTHAFVSVSVAEIKLNIRLYDEREHSNPRRLWWVFDLLV